MRNPSIYAVSAGAILALAALSSPAWTADGIASVKLTPVLTTTSPELTWFPVDILPPGAQATLLAKAGDWQVARVKIPPHFVVPPHSHHNAEAIWVVGGKIGFGFGQKVDMSGPMLAPGAFFAQPGGTFHYLWTGDEAAVIDVQVDEPQDMNFANPTDDPRIAKK
jgi:hypothetical protein